MSFYYPIISSDIEKRACKKKVNKKLEDLYDDLKWLIHWEDTYNSEISFYEDKKKVSDYIYLKNVIDKLLDK